MARGPGDQRFSQTGVSTAGDAVYERTYQGRAFVDMDYEGFTKDELQSLLEARGLPKSGNKDELIARLNESD